MAVCFNHPSIAAIETCEVCHRSLCGRCLWYADDGRRLCAKHAVELASEGIKMVPPDTYEEAFDYGVIPRDFESERQDPNLYQGNQNDLYSLLAAAAGVMTLAICSGFGAYCMPVIGLVLGLIAFSQARDSVDPKRTKILAGIGIGGSTIMIAFILFFILLYVGIFAIAIAAGP